MLPLISRIMMAAHFKYLACWWPGSSSIQAAADWSCRGWPWKWGWSQYCHETMMAKLLELPGLMDAIDYIYKIYSRSRMSWCRKICCCRTFCSHSQIAISQPCALTLPPLGLGALFTFFLEAMDAEESQEEEEEKGSNLIKADQKWKISWTNKHPGWFIGRLNPNKW